MDKILKDKKAIFIFIAPALLMFVLVLIVPICQMLYYSLCDYAALTPPKFVGLANYKKLFFKDFHAVFRSQPADRRSGTGSIPYEYSKRQELI